MDSEKFSRFAKTLIDFLYADRFVPEEVIRTLGLLAVEDPQVVQKLIAIWEKTSEERRQSGKSVREINRPLVLSRGFDETTAEDELSRFLPEEKILINKDIFRKKLHGVDFSVLDSAREQALVEELRNESIGLSRDDTILYFNLLKINSLSHNRKTGNLSATSQEGAQMFYTSLWQTFERDWGLSPVGLAKLNGGKAIPPQLLLDFVKEKLKTNRMNPKILGLLFGFSPNKFAGQVKAFLVETATQRGESADELLQHFAAYILLGGAHPDSLQKLGLSAPLLSFVTDKIGRLREIYYVSILFAYTFFFVLVTQVYEIAVKYQQSPEDQKAKLSRLYSSDERLALLVANAANLATKRIADYKVESREVLSNLKRFTAAHRDLVTAKDLFNTTYGD